MRRVAASLAVTSLLSGCVGSSETTPLIKAVEHGTTDDVKRVLDSGAKINEKDYANSTALFSAARRGGLENSTFFSTEAPISSRSLPHMTPLMGFSADGDLGGPETYCFTSRKCIVMMPEIVR
jgi:hypothetical protein